jgi:hypothetical protein
MSNLVLLFISLSREIPLFCIRIQNMNSEFEMAHALADSANRKKRPFQGDGHEGFLESWADALGSCAIVVEPTGPK